MYVRYCGIIPTADPNRDVLAVSHDLEDYASRQVDHSEWDGLMKSHVSRCKVEGIELNGVDYKALAGDQRFEAYKQQLASVDLKALTPNEELALYINAYNCLCIGHIVNHYQTTGALPASINQITGKKKEKVWAIPAGVVGGVELSLDIIEHKILRQRWKEPRVHASIVCASASCPDLRAEAFVPDRINAQMDDQCLSWMSNSAKGFALNGQALMLSRIFLWFKEDFVAVSAGVEHWATQYLPKDHEARRRVADKAKYSIDYFEYNWNLNQALPEAS